MPLVNLAGVGTGFAVLPEMQCDAVFTGFKNGISKNRNPRVSCEFTLGESAGEHAGSKAFTNYTFTEAALWAFKKAVIQMGIPADDPRLEDPSGIDSDELLSEVMGCSVRLNITRGEYEGKANNQVEIIDDLSW